MLAPQKIGGVFCKMPFCRSAFIKRTLYCSFMFFLRVPTTRSGSGFNGGIEVEVVDVVDVVVVDVVVVDDVDVIFDVFSVLEKQWNVKDRTVSVGWELR